MLQFAHQMHLGLNRPYRLVYSGEFPMILVHVAGSSMRLAKLKPQSLGPDRGPDHPVQKKF